MDGEETDYREEEPLWEAIGGDGRLGRGGRIDKGACAWLVGEKQTQEKQHEKRHNG